MSTDNNRKKYSQRRKGRAQGFYGSLVDKLKLGLAAGSDRGFCLRLQQHTRSFRI